MEQTNTPKKKLLNKRNVINLIGLILCIILVPILIINCILIVKGIANDKEVPSIGGNAPLIVLTDSMNPTIHAGDLIICRLTDADEVEVGDVISFFDPEGNGSSIVTHRVIAVETDTLSGEIYFRTQGDNNDIADRSPVPAENLVGKWEGSRIWGLGYVILFTQSTVGMIIIIAVIVSAIFVYVMLKKRAQDKEKQSDIDQLKAELEALKAAQSKDAADVGASAENSPSENDGKDGE